MFRDQKDHLAAYPETADALLSCRCGLPESTIADWDILGIVAEHIKRRTGRTPLWAWIGEQMNGQANRPTPQTRETAQRLMTHPSAMHVALHGAGKFLHLAAKDENGCVWLELDFTGTGGVSMFMTVEQVEELRHFAETYLQDRDIRQREAKARRQPPVPLPGCA